MKKQSKIFTFLSFIGVLILASSVSAQASDLQSAGSNCNDIIVIDGQVTERPCTTTAVPEPATMLLVGGGLAAMAAKRFRVRAAKKR